MSIEIAKIEKFEYPAIVKYLRLKVWRDNLIYKYIFNIRGEESPLHATVKNCIASFKRGSPLKMKTDQEAQFLFPPLQILI